MSRTVIALLVFSVIGVLVISAGTRSYPEGRITIRVVDEESRPVEKAAVGFGFQVGSKAYFGNEEIAVRGLTNMSGEFSGSEKADRHVGFSVQKEGYYTTAGKFTFQESAARKWKPWNPQLEVRIKKVGKPIAMYAKKVNLAVPEFGVPVGYDLMIGDWVAPYGRGKLADILFTAGLQQRGAVDYEYELRVSFSNQGDGIQTFEMDPVFGSALRSPRIAPEDGYMMEWRQFRRRTAGGPEISNVSDTRGYIFRVRTVADQRGEIVSALYGKIYGDFLKFAYYLNPAGNDRNIEYDPDHNLFGALKGCERVRWP